MNTRNTPPGTICAPATLPVARLCPTCGEPEYVSPGGRHHVLCRLCFNKKHAEYKRNKKAEYAAQGKTKSRSKDGVNAEEDALYDLLAFPDPEKFLDMIRAICQPKIDRRTREHRTTHHAGSLGRAKLGAA